MAKQFTGKHMAAVLVGGFGVVIAVNFAMASVATSTFGGTVVDNSYVASQHFNSWLDAAERSRELGWQVQAARQQDGTLAVTLDGAPQGATVSGLARHPLGRQADVELEFSSDADGIYRSSQALSDGRWTLRLKVESAGEVWRGEQALP